MLEAMANRIFVCATAVDGVTDVLSNETGLLMPENPTVEQLTAFLEMLCSMDKEKFAARAKLGYDCWQQWFNADENCLAFATELSAVEDIQPDEPPKEQRRLFHSWKPEEQAAEVEAEMEAAEAEAAEEAEEPEETAGPEPAPETTEEPAPADEPAEPEAEPEEPPEEPRPDEPADEAARELLSMIDEIIPEEPQQPDEPETPEPAEEPAGTSETAEEKPAAPSEKP